MPSSSLFHYFLFAFLRLSLAHFVFTMTSSIFSPSPSLSHSLSHILTFVNALFCSTYDLFEVYTDEEALQMSDNDCSFMVEVCGLPYLRRDALDLMKEVDSGSSRFGRKDRFSCVYFSSVPPTHTLSLSPPTPRALSLPKATPSHFAFTRDTTKPSLRSSSPISSKLGIRTLHSPILIWI